MKPASRVGKKMRSFQPSDDDDDGDEPISRFLSPEAIFNCCLPILKSHVLELQNKYYVWN